MGWGLFISAMLVLFILDAGWVNRHAHSPTVKESLWRTAAYVAAAGSFGAWTWYSYGQQTGLEFFTGYVLELSLSMDNVFVISMIFGALSIPSQYRGRVLLWGVIGALLLRGAFIFSGSAIVSEFRWLLVGFGAFLVFTGVRMLFDSAEKEIDIEKNRTLMLLRRWFAITPTLHGEAFFVGRAITPLFVALCMVEVADLIFAVDSVPAIFAVTTDPYVVYTSNIFAILGLRSLFFVLEAAVNKFERLGTALAIVLAFIGAKVIAAEVLGFHIPIIVSLCIILMLLCGGIAASLLKDKHEHA